MRSVLGALSILLAVTGTSTVASAQPSRAALGSTRCSGYASCSRGSFTTNGYQQHAGTSYWTMYAGNNCTNYVAYVESTVYGVPTPTYNLGDGGAWAAAAARHGVRVDRVPSVGAVAVWFGGSSGIPWPGHVAVVEDVGPRDRYVDISQQHMSGDPDGFDWTRIYRNAAENEWQQWPNRFVHFRGGPGSLVDGVHLGVASPPPNAIVSADGVLATPGRTSSSTRARIGRDSSPSITALPRGFEVAYPTAQRELAASGVDGDHRYRVRVRTGTNPSITAVLHGFEVALQATSGHLVTIGAAGTHTWSARMRPGTSPSVTPLFGGGYEVAVQSSAGTLETMGTDGRRRWRIGLRPGTSPSITALFGGGYEVAVQSRAGRLVTVGAAGSRLWGVRMQPRSSPSIAPVFGGGFEVAVQSSTRGLWAVGALGTRHWRIGVRSGTSPSIAAIHGGGFEVALQSVDGRLVTVGSRRARRWRLRMERGTSPSIRP